MTEGALSIDKLDALRAAMTTYFIDEKWESALFIAVGAAMIVFSFVLYRADSLYKAAAVPLVLFALIQIAVGAVIYQRTDNQLSGLYKQAGEQATQYQQEEGARMDKVLSSFKLYRGVEIALLLLGIALCLVFREKMHLYAGGVGLIGQAALMLVLDLVAEKRADIYVASLKDAFGG